MGLKPTWPIVGWLLPLPQEPRDEAQFEIPLGRIHLLRRATDHHGRPRRRGLLQAPPLPLLRRRRRYAVLPSPRVHSRALIRRSDHLVVAARVSSSSPVICTKAINTYRDYERKQEASAAAAEAAAALVAADPAPATAAKP